MKNKKLFAILTLVCFMFTLMPVAAFANDAVADKTLFYAVEGDSAVSVKGTADLTDKENAVAFKLEGLNSAGETAKLAKDTFVYVWAKNDKGVVVSALEVKDNTTGFAYAGEVTEATVSAIPQYAKAFKVIGDNVSVVDFLVGFAAEGDYTVYAAITDKATDKYSELANVTVAGSGEDVITAIGDALNPDTQYFMTVTGVDGAVVEAPDAKETAAGIKAVVKVQPNNVVSDVKLTFTSATKADKSDEKKLTHKDVTIKMDTANVTVVQEDETTGYAGVVDLKLSASREGNYLMYVTVEGKTFIVKVESGNTKAAYIETVLQPSNPIAQFTVSNDFGATNEDPKVIFHISDINGNAVVENTTDVLFGTTNHTDRVKYLYFVEKPAASNLRDADLTLMSNGGGDYSLEVAKTLSVEGKYVVKAILDNGAVATATWEVKRFAEPVAIVIKGAPATVELGKTFAPSLYYVDANNVEKAATDAKLAATGYAIASFGTTTSPNQISLKTDEKYAGSVVKLAAVSEMYDLVATKEVKIAAEATEIAFAKDALDVNVNNKVVWNVVDAEGNIVKLNKVSDAKIRYVVLDKPEDAKVSVYDLTNPTNFDGDGKMALTSSAVGNVTVQVIAQVQFGNDATATDTLVAQQTKYYTGTQIFAVGTESVGDVVVMSIGSNEIVKNDVVATMVAAPIIENNRTFVPLRALAEAFGAEVAWDEATQSVTAELNGVTVVMTIGSAEYTINGEAATMDVAPFINSDSTMVPVRFAAQAFGIKVIPTYNPDGTTADILFNL